MDTGIDNIQSIYKIMQIVHPLTECQESKEHSFDDGYKIPDNWPEAQTSGEATTVDIFIAGAKYGIEDAFSGWNYLTIERRACEDLNYWFPLQDSTFNLRVSGWNGLADVSYDFGKVCNWIQMTKTYSQRDF